MVFITWCGLDLNCFAEVSGHEGYVSHVDFSVWHQECWSVMSARWSYLESPTIDPKRMAAKAMSLY